MDGCDEEPFGLHLFEAPETEPPEAAGLLDLAEDRLDDRLAARVVASAGLGPELAAHPLAAREPGRDAAALREALGVSDRVLVQGARRRSLFLDKSGRVPLEPDLSMWDGDRCTFVGDAKYKRVVDEVVPNADLYQLLAYTIATDLPGGMLIYAAGEETPVTHEVVHLGKRLRTEALDLSGTPQATLTQIAGIADRIRGREIDQGVKWEQDRSPIGADLGGTMSS